MKKILALLMMSFFVLACSKSDPENPAPDLGQDSITLGAGSSENVVLGSSADQTTITFTASSSWTASTIAINGQNSSWCNVSPTNGQAGTGTITIKVAENTTYESRTASVSIKSGNASVIIKVEQVQKDAIALVQTLYEIGQEGGELDFDVITNAALEVVIPDSCSSWITRVQSRALDTTRLYFDIAPYTGNGSRKGTIVLKAGEISQGITVEQFGAVDVSSIPDDEMWYKTSDGTVMAFVSNDFGRNIVSNTYKGGIGKVKFDGPVTKISTLYSFTGREKVTALYLPDCVESFSISKYTGLKEVRVPKNIKEPDSNPFFSCTSL
ncbi:MAG: BACON domain-containing protein, partial [Bacteroidales bacterium]|nr:BACON domain-containing protein [Bacteroidales bacterium]